MKPITNMLLLLALVSYIFLPLFEISLMGSLSGLQFTASMISANLKIGYTLYSLVPFLLLFAAIAFNCLKNRYWGVLVAILIFGVIYFFITLTNVFQGFSLVHDPSVVSDTEKVEGMPIIGTGIGFYVSFILTGLAFISALVSLMPFKFNKKLEESIDSRIGKGFESGKKHISKVGHDIHGEFHKIGSHKQQRKPLPIDEPQKAEPVDEPQKAEPVDDQEAVSDPNVSDNQEPN